MKILILSAHPDDETIGAGGTIAALCAAGHVARLWIATETFEPRWTAAEKPRRAAEARKAAGILGVADVRFGGFQTTQLAVTPPMELASAVSDAVRDFAPDLLLAPPPGDIHSDHAALFNAALVAARGVPGNPVRAFYAYEIATTTRFAAPGAAFAPNTFVDVTDSFETKLAAMRAYQSEMCQWPHPRSVEGLTILARDRGLACGAAYAEAFSLVARRYAPGEAPLL